MIPQPQSDYFARALAYRLINETRRMQEDMQRLIWDHEPRMAEQRLRAWEDEIHRACHEMNEAANDTITRLREEVSRLHGMIVAPPLFTRPPHMPPPPDPEPVPSVEELYRELKPTPPAGEPHPIGCTCISCDPPF